MEARYEGIQARDEASWRGGATVGGETDAGEADGGETVGGGTDGSGTDGGSHCCGRLLGIGPRPAGCARIGRRNRSTGQAGRRRH